MHANGSSRIALAVAAVLTPAAVFAASTEDLQVKVDALQAKVDALEARQASTADVNATVEKVLRDAEARSQLLASEGFTAGYSKGKFLLQSADGNFVLNPYLQFQGRYAATLRDDAKHGEEQSTDDGFEIRRMKFGFAGNAVSPDLTYKFQWQTDRASSTKDVKDADGVKIGTVDVGSGGSVRLEDAWARYKFNRDWSVFGGQFEDVIAKDEFISSARQLAADQALATYLLIERPADYLQGIGLGYEHGPARLTGIFHDGAKSQNTNFQDGSSNWGTSGRAEWLALGDDWKQYEDYTARNNKSDLLVFGAGADYTEADNAQNFYHAADVQWEPISLPGFSAFASYLGNVLNPDGGQAAYNWGGLFQVGYAISNRWEIFGRYDFAKFDGSALNLPAGTNDRVQEFTIGANYYLNGHNAKFTFDLTWLPEGYDSNLAKTIGSADGLNVLPTSGDANEVVARLQFQLLL